jgi:hypothetical protein
MNFAYICESGSVAVPDDVTASLQDMGQANEMVLTNLLKSEQQSGRVLGDANVQDIAGLLMSVTYGLTVQARRGKTKEELNAIADMAISALPGNRAP